MLSGLSFFNKSASKDTFYKNEIVANLQKMNVGQKSIDKILAAIDKMPSHTHLLGALAFLTQLTEQHSVCERHYSRSDYIAEFFCTLSNLGFFAVAFYCKDFATLCVAACSALSHAIPLKRLNELDKLAAISVFFIMIANYHLLTNPSLVAAGLVTFAFGMLDLKVGRKYLDTWGPAFHSAWYLAAAYALYTFNQSAQMTSSVK